jgi:hypothetical protein
MPFEDIRYVLKGRIGSALRQAEFKELFNSSRPEIYEKVTEEHLHRQGIDVEVVSIVKAHPEAGGEYMLQWNTDAGGPPEHQFFTP